jgi:hypothetical protein
MMARRYVETLKLGRGTVAERVRPEWAAGVGEDLDAFAAIGAEFWKGFDAALADPDLAPQGQRTAAGRAGREAKRRLSEFEDRVVKPLRARIDGISATVSARAAITLPTDTGERIAWEMRAAEFRSKLPDDEMQRLAIYLASTDPFVAYAFESAPPTLTREHPGAVPKLGPLVDPARVAEATVARARAAADPATAELLEDLVALHALYARELAGLRAEIAEAVPAAPEEEMTSAKVPEDTVAALAAGKAHA